MENHPDHPEMGERTHPLQAHAYIEREDFMEDPPKKFFRLARGREVRLKGAYIIRCERSREGRKRQRRPSCSAPWT